MPLAVNSGPPSLEISSGTLKVVKKEQRWQTRPAEPARLAPAVTYDQVMAASVVKEVCEDGFKWG